MFFNLTNFVSSLVRCWRDLWANKLLLLYFCYRVVRTLLIHSRTQHSQILNHNPMSKDKLNAPPCKCPACVEVDYTGYIAYPFNAPNKHMITSNHNFCNGRATNNKRCNSCRPDQFDRNGQCYGYQLWGGYKKRGRAGEGKEGKGDSILPIPPPIPEFQYIANYTAALEKNVEGQGLQSRAVLIRNITPRKCPIMGNIPLDGLMNSQGEPLFHLVPLGQQMKDKLLYEAKRVKSLSARKGSKIHNDSTRYIHSISESVSKEICPLIKQALEKHSPGLVQDGILIQCPSIICTKPQVLTQDDEEEEEEKEVVVEEEEEMPLVDSNVWEQAAVAQVVEEGSAKKSENSIPDAINTILTHSSSPPYWKQLAPFLKLPRESSPPCTSLVVMGVFNIESNTLRTACEVFGALHNFRTDFRKSRGVAFVSYFDVRAAEKAFEKLGENLSKLSNSSGGEQLQNTIPNIHVLYCTPFHYSGGKDESAILIKYLPDTIEEEDIYPTLRKYGDVKKINEQVVNDGNTASFLVKFYDLQDSKQAHLVLSSSNPWGPGVSVSFANLKSTERKSGKELLELIGLWMHGPSVNNNQSASVRVRVRFSPPQAFHTDSGISKKGGTLAPGSASIWAPAEEGGFKVRYILADGRPV